MIIKEYSDKKLNELYAASFLGDRLYLHDISAALGLSSAKKNEFIQDYYKYDESKLWKWAKQIKKKCPKYYDIFIEIAELDEPLSESYIDGEYHPCMEKSDFNDILDDFTFELNHKYSDINEDYDCIIEYDYNVNSGIVDFYLFIDEHSGVIKATAMFDYEDIENGKVTIDDVIDSFEPYEE